MNVSHKPDKLLITGTSGTGKTTLYLDILRSHPARYKFIFDHEGELCFRLKCAPACIPEQMVDQTAVGVCVFDPCLLFPGSLPRGFDFFCDYSFTVSTRLAGQKLFCCDELQKLVGTDNCPRELATILETGRRYEIDLCCISQSPNLIHTRLRNQLTRIVTFRQVDDRAVQFLEAAGFDPEAVRALAPGAYLSRDLNSGQTGSGRAW